MCRKILAFLFAILFFLLFPVILYLHNFKYVFLRPAVYHTLIAQGTLQKTLTLALSEGLNQAMKATQAESGQPVILPISSEDIAEAVEKAISQKWLEEEVGGLLDRFFTWFYSDQETLDLSISFAPLKENFDEVLTQITQKTVQNLPQCSQDQLQKLQAGDQNVLCLPPGTSPSAIEESLKTISQNPEFQSFLAGIPAELDLLEIIDASKGGKNAAGKSSMDYLNDFRNYAHLIFLVLNLLTASLLVILVIIALLTWRPFSAVLKAVGTAILIPSLLVFLTSGVALILARFMKFSRLLILNPTNSAIPFNPAILDGFSEIINLLISRVNIYKLIESGIALVLAAILMILGALLKKKKVSAAQTS